MNAKRAACYALLASFALMALDGCGRSPPPRPQTPSYSLPALAPRPSFDPNARPPRPGDSTYSLSTDSLNGGAFTAIEASAVRRTGGGPGQVVNQALAKVTPGRAVAASSAPVATPVALPGTEAAKEEEKIEREAQLALEVKDVSEAATRVFALVRAHDGSVTKDQRSSGTHSTAELVVRVPSAQFDAFLSEMATVGEIRNRSIKAVDSSLEHKDLGILVGNLEAALARYRDLLQKATDPLQILAIERELERVTADLDRIKGRLDFLRDRVARSTIAIGLHSSEPPSDQTPFAHKPQISPGVRALSFVDVRESGTSGYVGSGLTLRLPSSGGESARGFILDVDVMRACCKSRPERSDWAYDILLGFDLYSDALQSGRRRWLNPYLGARVGFSQTQDRGDFAAAGVFGLEIFKTSALMIDVQARAVALVGNPDGPHAAVQPSIGFDLGF